MIQQSIRDMFKYDLQLSDLSRSTFNVIMIRAILDEIDGDQTKSVSIDVNKNDSFFETIGSICSILEVNNHIFNTLTDNYIADSITVTSFVVNNDTHVIIADESFTLHLILI